MSNIRIKTFQDDYACTVERTMNEWLIEKNIKVLHMTQSQHGFGYSSYSHAESFVISILYKERRSRGSE